MEKLTLLPGIAILENMSKIFCSIQNLAACVAAAVSESKKTVPAVAAAVVSIGLLLSPVESAQAQHFDGDLWRGDGR